MRSTNFRFLRHIFWLTAVVLLGWTPISWGNNILNCEQCCADNCNNCTYGSGSDDCVLAQSGLCDLETDITCDDTDNGILLIQGNDLDMDGHTITCTETTTTCRSAVRMDSSNNKLFNSEGAGLPPDPINEAIITGPFDTSVDCQGKTGSTVEGITVEVEGSLGFGIIRCRKVQNNVIRTAPGKSGFAGIQLLGIGNTDFIKRNYIEGDVARGIRVFGSKSIDVEENVIYTSDGVDIAIEISTITPAEILDNTIIGNRTNGQAITGGTASTSFKGNFCSKDHPDCQDNTDDCIDTNKCVHRVSPFRK